MEDGEKFNLDVRWKKYLTKFGNVLVAMNITEVRGKLQCCYIFEEIMYEKPENQ